MADLTRQERRNPRIRDFTASLVRDAGIPPKEYEAEIGCVFYWVRDNIRYTQDIINVETLQWPSNTLDDFGYGDCDDIACLLASCLESIGHECRFFAIAQQNPGEFDHVMAQVLVGMRNFNGSRYSPWMTLDATENQPPGWVPSEIVNFYIQPID